MTVTWFSMPSMLQGCFHLTNSHFTQVSVDTEVCPKCTAVVLIVVCQDISKQCALVHQQNVFWTVEASRSVWEDVECKLRCVNFRRVSDPKRAFLPCFRVTGISYDWCRSMMGVIVIGLGTRQSAGENCGCTWEHLGVPATTQGAQMTSLGAPASTSEKPGSASNKSGSTSNHCRAVWEKQHLLWERCWCTWRS